MVLEFLLQVSGRGMAGSQHHESLDHLAAGFVRAGHHRRLGDGRVFNQGAFHFKGADPVTGRQDYVIGAADEPEVAVFIPVGAVACHVPVAPARGGSAFGVVAILAEKSLGRLRFDAHADIPFRIRPRDVSFVVNDLQVDAGRRFAHGTGPGFYAGETGAEDYRLGLAVPVPDGQSGCFFPGIYDLGVERFARSGAVP